MINYGRRIGLEPHEKPTYGTVITDPFHPLSQGLVGHWLMNECSGNIAYDISGHGNQGTLANGPIWGGSKFGGGLQLDGVNDYVGIANSDSLNVSTGNCTISAWFNSNSVQTAGWPPQWIISKGQSDAYQWGLLQYNSVTSVYIWNTNGGMWLGVEGASVLQSNTWYHAVFALDNANDVLSFYLNGNLEGTSSTQTGSQELDNVADIRIGYRADNSGNHFNGSIDSVRIYNRALATWEIETLYHDPFCNLLRVPIRRHFVAAPPVGAIMNQFQNFNIGADLYNGGIIA